ncbi:glycosyltransferase family 2 protein [Chryseobacterium shandongense]|jgi:glycosyltransferase involved in cell wall biosynthesis|uniref:glycosyltransferase family 2 protein n=1 Tax=Chryseobacterium shandongense TaxID=1493872 RepID=UPI000F4EB5E4|nr:glycosyltransferase [Chryseobacterium shandongense]AZA59072.1 glycosyltransferase [Chryseobacterium shandongense]
MKFSILIAHYNNSHFFRDCYESIIKQTYTNWEAIIVDDASSEDEKNKIKEIISGDSRFTFFENNKNSGVGITKSRLIELAQGQICGFVDPDDAITSTAIQRFMEVFASKENIVLTYSRFMTCDRNLTPISPFRSAMQVPNGNPYFFNFPIQIAHFVAFRKDIYQTTEKMNPKLRIGEDQDLYLKMYEKGKVQFINEVNYLYRTHEGGISQNDNKRKSHEYFAQVIFNTMKRRGLTTINGKKIPDHYTDSQQIFDLLEYQHQVTFRVRKKIQITLQSIFR